MATNTSATSRVGIWGRARELASRGCVKLQARLAPIRRELHDFSWALERQILTKAAERGLRHVRFDVSDSGDGKGVAISVAPEQHDGRGELVVEEQLWHGRLAEFLQSSGVRSMLVDSKIESNQFSDIVEVLWTLSRSESKGRGRGERGGRLDEMARALHTGQGMHVACADVRFDAERGELSIEYSYCQTFFSQLVTRYKEKHDQFRDHRVFFVVAPRYATLATALLLIPWVLAFVLLVDVYVLAPRIRDLAAGLIVTVGIVMPLFGTVVWFSTFALLQAIGSVEYDKEVQGERLEAAHEQLQEAMDRVNLDLETAAEIQRAMLPSPDEQPFSDDVKITTRFRPEMAVGGDYFDYKAIDENHLAVILVDVSGHGLHAAFITGVVKTSFELAGDERLRPADFAARLNLTLERITPPGSFATMVYCVYDIPNRQLRYINAGHLPLPLAIEPDGRVGTLSDKTSLLIGAFDTGTFEEECFSIASGTKLLLATDGIIDAVADSGERFGQERLLSTVQEHAKGSAAELDQAIFDELQRFIGSADQCDDITALTLEFT